MKTLLHVPCSNEMQSQHFLPSSQDLWSMPVHLFLLSAQIPPPSSFAESVRTDGVPGWRAVLGVSACANFSGNCLTRKKKYHSYPHSMKVDVSFLFLFIFLFLRFSGVFPPSTLNIKIYVFQVPILSMKLYAKTGHACFSLAILWWGFGSQAISNLLPIYSSSTIVGFHLSP